MRPTVQVFEDVDLSDDWCDVDEGSGEPIMVSEISTAVELTTVKPEGAAGGGEKKKKKR